MSFPLWGLLFPPPPPLHFACLRMIWWSKVRVVTAVGYDARSRVLIKRVCAELGVLFVEIAPTETLLGKMLCVELALCLTRVYTKQPNLGKRGRVRFEQAEQLRQKELQGSNNPMRYVKVGAAVVGGATLLAVTGAASCLSGAMALASFAKVGFYEARGREVESTMGRRSCGTGTRCRLRSRRRRCAAPPKPLGP